VEASEIQWRFYGEIQSNDVNMDVPWTEETLACPPRPTNGSEQLTAEEYTKFSSLGTITRVDVNDVHIRIRPSVEQDMRGVLSVSTCPFRERLRCMFPTLRPTNQFDVLARKQKHLEELWNGERGSACV
jgi:hypothetical protein